LALADGELGHGAFKPFLKGLVSRAPYQIPTTALGGFPLPRLRLGREASQGIVMACQR
jgi:hypothetical protein